MDGIHIRNEILRCIALPIIDSINKYQFLSYNTTRSYIDNKKSSVSELILNLPSAKEITSKKEYYP